MLPVSVQFEQVFARFVCGGKFRRVRTYICLIGLVGSIADNELQPLGSNRVGGLYMSRNRLCYPCLKMQALTKDKVSRLGCLIIEGAGRIDSIHYRLCEVPIRTRAPSGRLPTR